MLKRIMAPPAPPGRPPPPAAPTTSTVVAAASAPDRPVHPARPRNYVPVLVLNRFVEAMQVAVLAAENGMHGLSLRAVGDALEGARP